ncbi:unnamed protein product [Rhizopus microsporus]
MIFYNTKRDIRKNWLRDLIKGNTSLLYNQRDRQTKYYWSLSANEPDEGVEAVAKGGPVELQILKMIEKCNFEYSAPLVYLGYGGRELDGVPQLGRNERNKSNQRSFNENVDRSTVKKIFCNMLQRLVVIVPSFVLTGAPRP